MIFWWATHPKDYFLSRNPKWRMKIRVLRGLITNLYSLMPPVIKTFFYYTIYSKHSCEQGRLNDKCDY